MERGRGGHLTPSLGGTGMQSDSRKRGTAAAAISGCMLGGALAAIAGGIAGISPGVMQPICVVASGGGGFAGVALYRQYLRTRPRPDRAEPRQVVLESRE